MDRIGKVAYKLQLPLDAKVHEPIQQSLPLLDNVGMIAKEPSAVLDHRMINCKGQASTEVLVQWTNTFPEDATWELLHDLQLQYPYFNP